MYPKSLIWQHEIRRAQMIVTTNRRRRRRLILAVAAALAFFLLHVSVRQNYTLASLTQNVAQTLPPPRRLGTDWKSHLRVDSVERQWGEARRKLWTWTSDHATALANDCASFVDSDDIAVVLKTGASEIHERLPVHYYTTLACIKDYLVFSDTRQRLGEKLIHDALENISTTQFQDESGLEEYRYLREQAVSTDPATIRKGQMGWRLDKWKFLPMIKRAFDMYGARKNWFVFMEADTYLSLHNLLLWLKTLDHSKKLYSGSLIFIGETEFAHGGSGWILSSTAAGAAADVYTEEQAFWDARVAGDCCGDKIVAEVLRERSASQLQAFPHIQGETPSSLDWSETHWCRPAITWHHMSSGELDHMWAFETAFRARNGRERPILFRDYFAAFIMPRLAASNGSMADWDNLSSDWVLSSDKDDEGSESSFSDAARSADRCEAFCRDQKACLQWAWQPDSCRANRLVRLGWPIDGRPKLGSADDYVIKMKAENVEGAVSGWLLERIEDWKLKMEPCMSEGVGVWATASA